MRAADVSNWTGEIAVDQARCLRAEGIALLICGTQVPAITRAQVAAATAAGMRCEAYVILRWDGDVDRRVAAARAAVRDLPVRRLWVDCEDYPGVATPPPAETRGLVAKALAACASMPSGIYTSRRWWVTATEDWRAPGAAGVPLWDARYVRRDGDPIPPFVPYGGWARAAMTQWHDTTARCGVTLCLDETEDSMDEPLLDPRTTRDALAELLRQEGVLGARIDRVADDLRATGAEFRRLIALLCDGHTEDARRRLRYEMAAAGESWPDAR
ncbi:MAG TPA: hypothetical protein VFC53_12805 [Dehalococcoidia bacterium]|nr:hypothetical protein [Dehalococcoidia bacterium]